VMILKQAFHIQVVRDVSDMNIFMYTS